MPLDAGTGLPAILEAVRRRWWLTLLVALPVFVGAAAYAQLAPPQYTAKAIVALEPRAAVNVGPPDMPILGQKYVAYATSSTTIAQVARAAGVPAQTLAGAVQAKVPVQSVDFVITVTLRSPIAAAVAANDLADAVVRLTRSDTLVSGQVVAPAARPTTPSAPRRKLIEAAGLLLALFIGVVVSTLVERGRPRIRSALEVAYVTGHAVIGRVPRSRALRRGMGQAIADPLLGGAVRSLRTVLDHEGRNLRVHALAVTSSVPAEGKSSVASLLATAIARLDAHVLLIDGDLRHPSLAQFFGVPAKPGLAEVLRGETPLPECVHQLPGVPGLSVLATTGTADAGDLIARGGHEVLQWARSAYDVVIIDSPPLLVGDDAGTLATFADAVLLVVRAGVETRRLAEAGRALDTLGVRVIGAVLNRVSGESYGYPQADSAASWRGGPSRMPTS